MNPTDAPRDSNRFRLTTGGLMVWVLAAGLALGFLKSDVADWLSPNGTFALLFVTLVALVLGIPCLAVAAERSTDPSVTRPPSTRERRAEHLMTVGCLGLITAALLSFGLLAYMAFTAGG